MRSNPVLAALRAGRPSFGVWLTIGSTVLAEEVALGGFEWALIDLQHGYWAEDALLSALQTISHTPTVPIVRPAANDPTLIGRALDQGALGVVVPMVNSRAEAEQAAAAVRYPPAGTRSAGGSRTLLYGDDYFTAANPEILLAVMIETRRAVEGIDDILSVPGIDCAFIGPGDLALDLGTYGQQSERHEEALQTILRAGQRHGVAVGLACGSAEVAQSRAAQGFQFLDVGVDIAFFWQGLRAAQQAMKEM